MSLLQTLLDRPIAYHRCFVPFGGVTGAVLLSQAIYWSSRTSNESGWFWKTRDEWERETGLSRREQESARKRLVGHGILIEERRGTPAKLYFKVDFDQLEELLASSNQHKTLLSSVSKKPEVTSGTNKKGGIRPTRKAETAQHTITEITTKTTSRARGEVTQKQEETDSTLEDYLQSKREVQVKRALRKKHGGSIPPWVDVDEVVGSTVVDIPVSVTITQEFRDFCEEISEDRKAFHLPTIEGQQMWNQLMAEGYKPAHIKCACRLAYRDSEFWRDNFTPVLFFRRKSSESGEYINNIEKFLNMKVSGKPELVKIKQEMKHELENK